VNLHRPEEGVYVYLLKTVLSTSDVMKQLASQFDLNADQAGSVVSALLPVLGSGLKKRLTSDRGSTLSSLISDGSLSKFADNPASLASVAALTQGYSILIQIFAHGDLIDIACTVAEEVGISSSIVTRILPIATALLGGLLAKNTASGRGNLTEMLGSMAVAGQGGMVSGGKSLASQVPR
jgi:hypothetical protein